MGKSSLSKLVDDFIMAPHKVMNSAGDDPASSTFYNLIQQPSTKISGLLTAAFAAVSDPSLMQQTLTAGFLGMTAYQGLRLAAQTIVKGGRLVYFDTDPQNALRRTDDGLKVIFELAYSRTQNRDITISTIIGGLAMAVTPFTSAPTSAAILAGAAGVVTDLAARRWRIRQVLQDEWVATLSPPTTYKKVKREKLFQMEPELQLQPIPVRSR